MAIFEYINGFYNPRRRHSALCWKSLVAFERKVALTSTWGGTKARQVQKMGMQMGRTHFEIYHDAEFQTQQQIQRLWPRS